MLATWLGMQTALALATVMLKGLRLATAMELLSETVSDSHNLLQNCSASPSRRPRALRLTHHLRQLDKRTKRSRHQVHR